MELPFPLDQEMGSSSNVAVGHRHIHSAWVVARRRDGIEEMYDFETDPIERTEVVL